MLYFGTNITAPADMLQPVAVEKIYHSLRYPKPGLRQLVDQLRIIQTLDKAAYRNQKKMLPYLVCAAFKPAIRRRENFLNIGYFMVDLDGISPHFDKAALCKKLAEDPQLMLLFTSPGGDGLKLLYRLAQKCSDYGLFSAFYKLFVNSLASRYHLHAIVDASTSDVTRACFISYDEDAWYNAEAQPVDINAYINVEETDTLWEAATIANEALKEAKGKEVVLLKEKTNTSPSDEAIAFIRQKLNPNFKKPVQKQHYVPPEIDVYLQKIVAELQLYNLQLLESSAISYGRKLKIGTAGAWAEINLFYGKRGFTFVKTTKTGSNAELAEVCVQLLQQLLYKSNSPL